MDRTEIQALIDRVIGKKGIMRAPSWWVRRLFNKVIEYGESYANAAVKDVKITSDTTMSNTSTNPVQNKVIKEYIDNAVNNVKVEVDTEMSDESENAVGNKVIKGYVDGLVGDIGSVIDAINGEEV